MNFKNLALSLVFTSIAFASENTAKPAGPMCPNKPDVLINTFLDEPFKKIDSHTTFQTALTNFKDCFGVDIGTIKIEEKDKSATWELTLDDNAGVKARDTLADKCTRKDQIDAFISYFNQLINHAHSLKIKGLEVEKEKGTSLQRIGHLVSVLPAVQDNADNAAFTKNIKENVKLDGYKKDVDYLIVGYSIWFWILIIGGPTLVIIIGIVLYFVLRKKTEDSNV